MNWHPYIPYKNTPRPADGHYLGQIASVYLNDDQTLIKRTYNLNGVTVNDSPSEYSAEFIKERWAREYRWINEFNGEFFEGLVVGENDNIVIGLLLCANDGCKVRSCCGPMLGI